MTRTNWRERFEAYHEANPHVYDTLVSLAREAKARGFGTIGIDLLVGRLRWELAMRTEDPNPGPKFKFANGYCAHYARLMMEREPDLAGLFKVRPLRGSAVPCTPAP